MNQIISQSKRDIQSDQNEFIWLLKNIAKRNSDLIIKKSIDQEIDRAVKVKKSKVTIDFLNNYHTAKFEQIKSIRLLSLKVSALLIAGEWQSPSFHHANQKMNGELSGKIFHTLNDYKRDQHQIEFEYEGKFTQQFLPNSLQFSSLTTNSGMSAFTTINHFIANINEYHTVLLGKRSYFEIKKLVKQTYENVIEFDEVNPQSIDGKVIKNTQAIFFDTLSNDQDTLYTNPKDLIKYFISKNKSLIFVIDNTVPSFTSNIFSGVSKENIIGYESLNKHHQYGLDLVTGGIIYAKSSIIKKVHKLRMNLGTNISDINALTLPIPNKKHLKTRLDRITQNTKIIRSYFSPDQIHKSKINSTQPFIAFKFSDLKKMKVFVANVYKKSKKENIEITGGTSFGLSTSRLYLTALHSDEDTHPFVRFSPGTETKYHIEKIANILHKEYAKLSK